MSDDPRSRPPRPQRQPRPSREGGGAPVRAGHRGRGRPRTNLSLETVLDASIEILDADGEAGLTFRGLAARLGGGVASVYWYVRSKDELLHLASDQVVGHVLPAVDAARAREPIEAIRSISHALFLQIEAHPWAAAFLLHDPQVQQNAMLFWEGLGQQFLRLELTDFQRFQGVSTVVNYVVGIGAQMAMQQPPPNPGRVPEQDLRADVLGTWADQWLELDPEQFPFAHSVAPIFRDHDDFEQFASGLDLVLSGIERQAGLA